MTGLTERQNQVCRLIGYGFQNKEIARKLNISLRTVENHRRDVYRRLGVRNAVELVREILGAGNERTNESHAQ